MDNFSKLSKVSVWTHTFYAEDSFPLITKISLEWLSSTGTLFTCEQAAINWDATMAASSHTVTGEVGTI